MSVCGLVGAQIVRGSGLKPRFSHVCLGGVCFAVLVASYSASFTGVLGFRWRGGGVAERVRMNQGAGSSD